MIGNSRAPGERFTSDGDIVTRLNEVVVPNQRETRLSRIADQGGGNIISRAANRSVELARLRESLVSSSSR